MLFKTLQEAISQPSPSVGAFLGPKVVCSNQYMDRDSNSDVIKLSGTTGLSQVGGVTSQGGGDGDCNSAGVSDRSGISGSSGTDVVSGSCGGSGSGSEAEAQEREAVVVDEETAIEAPEMVLKYCWLDGPFATSDIRGFMHFNEEDTADLIRYR
jgi:hypothetical protein